MSDNFYGLPIALVFEEFFDTERERDKAVGDDTEEESTSLHMIVKRRWKFLHLPSSFYISVSASYKPAMPFINSFSCSTTVAGETSLTPFPSPQSHPKN